jgi:hypothetical protein
MPPEATLDTLREQEYTQRLEVNRLRREVFEQLDPAASAENLDRLQSAENALNAIQDDIRAQVKLLREEEGKIPSEGLILDNRQSTGLFGADTTGLEAQITLRMAQVPTALSHLLSPEQNPLVNCKVSNVSDKKRRLRITSYIEGYSAQAVETVELDAKSEYTFSELPTLFRERVEHINELTRATLNVLLEDLDGAVEIHKTVPIWLLARTTAPLAVKDPVTAEWQDLTHFLGAFVTPNAPSVMSFLRKVAAHHPDGQLVGYQGDETKVEPQVRAMFNALKTDAGITYVNSLVTFSPEEGAANQRVRLPRESLQDGEANCIDGTLLFASLLEAASLSPAIVLVPGHAFIAWETWKQKNQWRFLETTMIGKATFEEACRSAEAMAKRYRTEAEQTKNPLRFRLRPLRSLRASDRITPLE